MASKERDALQQRTALAEEIALLCARLGVSAIVRDPVSTGVLASVPGAELTILGADPAHVNVISTTLGGLEVRVESLRTADQIWHQMTPRQLEVAAGVVEGLTNAQLSERLGITEHTVRGHLEGVFLHLGVGSREEASAEFQRRQIAGTLPGRCRDAPGRSVPLRERHEDGEGRVSGVMCHGPHH